MEVQAHRCGRGGFHTWPPPPATVPSKNLSYREVLEFIAISLDFDATIARRHFRNRDRRRERNEGLTTEE